MGAHEVRGISNRESREAKKRKTRINQALAENGQVPEVRRRLPAGGKFGEQLHASQSKFGDEFRNTRTTGRTVRDSAPRVNRTLNKKGPNALRDYFDCAALEK